MICIPVGVKFLPFNGAFDPPDICFGILFSPVHPFCGDKSTNMVLKVLRSIQGLNILFLEDLIDLSSSDSIERQAVASNVSNSSLFISYLA